MKRMLLSLGVGTVLVAAAPAIAQDNDWSEIQRGLYLVRAGDCAACHTVKGQAPYSGGYSLETPFGTIYSANLTPDQDTGLGSWSEADFYRAMNEGISKDGSHLYPAFPYTHFTYATRDDIDAIFTYLNSLDPVRNRVPEPDLTWPLGWRFLMTGWNVMNFEDETFQPDPDRSEAYNRGKYLVEGLMHCGMCHSPKNVIGAEKGGDSRFTGGTAEGWLAPPLTGGPREGIGDWSEEDLVAFLKEGRNARTIAFGPMADVVKHSTQYMRDDDLQAIAAYIKALPENDDADAGETDEIDDDTQALGELIYATQCSACHASDGSGVAHMLPPLKGSSFVQADNPQSVVKLILEGGQGVATDQYPTQHAMPSFAWKLSDDEVAAVATFVRNAFGNQAPAVSAEEVADYRH
ncbi:cytochrome c [Amorphus sp. 3PC139-8]|uniref:c-type cytochrome n=1 Tax=Amorphus sp. 3PC139-8 TaxID=2735676 RepID=UPI00345DBD79